MAVNYADNVSAVKAVSQKTRLVEVPIKIQEKTEESALNSPSTSPWVRNKSRVLKLVLAVKMQWKQAG